MKPNPKLGLFAETGIPPMPRPRREKSEPPTFHEYINSQFGVVCTPEYQFCYGRKWRFDYAIIPLRIAVEVEGGTWINGRHIRPQTYLRDLEKYNNAAAHGWLLLRVIPQDLYSTEFADLLRAAIRIRTNNTEILAR